MKLQELQAAVSRHNDYYGVIADSGIQLLQNFLNSAHAKTFSLDEDIPFADFQAFCPPGTQFQFNTASIEDDFFKTWPMHDAFFEDLKHLEKTFPNAIHFKRKETFVLDHYFTLSDSLFSLGPGIWGIATSSPFKSALFSCIRKGKGTSGKVKQLRVFKNKETCQESKVDLPEKIVFKTLLFEDSNIHSIASEKANAKNEFLTEEEMKDLEKKWIVEVQREVDLFREANDFARMIPFRNRKNQLKLGLVLPELPGIGLEKYLDSNISKGKVNFLQALELAIWVSAAIKKIHDKEILHRDLSLTNIIVDVPNKNASICDFGGAIKIADLDAEEDKRDRTTYVFLCPEYHSKKNQTIKSDIASFGILMGIIMGVSIWTLASKRVKQNFWGALEEYKPDADLVFSGFISSGNSKIDTTLKTLITKMTASDPSKRPGWKEIESELENIRAATIRLQNANSASSAAAFFSGSALTSKIAYSSQIQMTASSIESSAIVRRQLRV